ncbi:reverse transcriptase [Elysia marginata]|uniref:Reverse transcriptase n=1 Tax=Elysia marginata TaxID=1093978 RepID=A0AAV4HGE0_9GAST|nr:reverse transcriptase [Elysia marginata]
MSYHFYADDKQLFKGASPKHITELTIGLEHCVRDVKAWMNSNKLKLNDDKTEILLMKISRQTINTPSVSINHSIIDMEKKAKNLGVIFDSDFSMQHQLSSLCKSLHFQLWKKGSIREYLTEKVRQRLS